MKVGNTEIDIDSLLDEKELETNFLKNDNGILLSDNHISILNRYNIDYKKYTSVNQLLYEIEDILNDSYGDNEDLEWVSMDISERNYYQNTKK